MHANIVVGLLLVAVVAQAALSLRLMQLRARVGRVEANELELSRSIAEMQGWSSPEIGAQQGAETVREPARALPLQAGAEPDPEEQRATLATSAPVEALQGDPAGDAEDGEDNETTTVFDSEALCHALRSTPWLVPEAEEDEVSREDRSAMFVTAFQPPAEKAGSP